MTAQTLGEVAQREEARRKKVENPARIYTNADLKGANPLAAPAPPPPTAVPEQSPADTKGKDGTPAAGDSLAAPERPSTPDEPQEGSEAWWRAKMAKLREDADRSRTYLDALQSRINALTTDFVNRDDPYQRAVIESDRNKAMAELERLKTELQRQTQAMADLQEEARHAGVPPGWLR